MNLEKVYKIINNSGSYESNLKDIFSKSEKTILYFYPKDNTPGCSIEAQDFSCMKEQFEKKGVNIYGISKDPIESHKKFIDKLNLDIDLITDPDLKLHKELGAFGEKNNYGKIIMGVIRSTFIFDKNGKLIKEYRNVRAKGHAKRVLEEL